MKRLDAVLIVIVLLELGVAAWMFWQRDTGPRPPLPPLTPSHALRGDLERLVAACKSTSDWHELAEIYTAYGFYAQSNACYDFLLSRQPDDPQLLFESGFLQSQMGRVSDANAKFESAIRAGYSTPSECWYFMGLNFLRAEQPDKAVDAFSQSGELASAKFELARLRYRIGDAQTAMELLGSVLEQESDKIEPNVLAYLCELELGHVSSATRYSERAAHTSDRILGPFHTQWMRLDAALDRVGYRHRLAVLQADSKRNRTPISEPALLEAARLEWNEFSVSSLAELAEMKGDLSRAVAVRQEIIQRRGPSTLSLARLADTYLHLNDTTRAVDTMRQAVEAQSEEDLTDAFERLARWSGMLGHDQDAEHYTDLHQLWTGKVAFWRSNWKDAESHLTFASKRMPQSDEVWFFLAEAHRRLKKTDEATAAYKRCLSINPQHGGAHRGLEILAWP